MSGALALAGIVLGALLAAGGGYLATRTIDRRQRRAQVVADLATDMEIKLSMLPGDWVGDLWALADRARASAMATSPKDTRLTYAMLDALDELRPLIRLDSNGDPVDVPGTGAALAAVRAAFDAYLDHVAAKLRVPRRPHRPSG